MLFTFWCSMRTLLKLIAQSDVRIAMGSDMLGPLILTDWLHRVVLRLRFTHCQWKNAIGVQKVVLRKMGKTTN